MKIYSDGYCIGSNPSKTGGGYTVVDEDDKLLHHEQIEKEGLTNNETELLGCVEAMKRVEEGGIVSVDSQVVLCWITYAKYIPRKSAQKEEKRGRKDLDDVKREGYTLMENKKIKLIFEPRDLNKAGHYNESVLKVDEWTKRYD